MVFIDILLVFVFRINLWLKFGIVSIGVLYSFFFKLRKVFLYFFVYFMVFFFFVSLVSGLVFLVNCVINCL